MKDVSVHRRNLAAALKEARMQSGLSQVDVAERLEVPQSWVSNVETGVRRLDLIEAWMLADVIDIDISQLRTQINL